MNSFSVYVILTVWFVYTAAEYGIDLESNNGTCYY